MYNGVFITFEGGEGAGKTTQIPLLQEYLQSLGHKVICTREPGGTPFAENIRTLLVTDKGHTISAECELALLIASRLHHVQMHIIPALQQGAVVLCDRFIDSSLVYQGIAGNLGIDRVWQAHKLLMGKDFIVPDMTIYLDIAPHIGLGRAQGGNKNQDRFENKSLDFHTHVRQGYLQIAEQFSHHKIINADQDIQDIFNNIKQLWDNMHI